MFSLDVGLCQQVPFKKHHRLYILHILDLFYMKQTVLLWSFSQGKRDESTSVDAAKAKADAKVHSLQLVGSLCFSTCFLSKFRILVTLDLVMKILLFLI